MKANEIRERIEKIDYLMFIESMADFMNWARYNELKREKAALQNELKQMGE